MWLWPSPSVGGGSGNARLGTALIFGRLRPTIHAFRAASKAWMDRPSPTMRKDATASFFRNALPVGFEECVGCAAMALLAGDLGFGAGDFGPEFADVEI